MTRKYLLIGLLVLPHYLFSQSTILQYLSGTDKDHTVDWDFYCTEGRRSGSWQKIAVPSNWELQGFGTYNYGHDKNKAHEQGLYKRAFRLAPSSDKKEVYLVFEGSMTDTEVKINGQLAGPPHQGGFYRFKYNITSLLKTGDENLLEVTVRKTSEEPSINRAERNGDFWLFGGIFRPVYLEIVPRTHIDRLAIDARADGSFQVDGFLHHLKGGEIVQAQVQTLSGEKVGAPFSVKAVSGQDSLSLKSAFNKPLLWSAEFPHLYQVVLSIKNNKEVVHRVKQRFGFRTVELRKEDGLYVNGAKIILKGSDRHSFWPETGRTLSHAIDLLDVRLMKEMNMNAVRMSHYPPDQDFLDVCDSLGLYVLDELTGWQAAYDTAIGHKLVKELVVRDVNHPSVLIWDNGNEGGWNRALDNDYSIYDPQHRLVIHPWEKFNGTNTKHYPDYKYLLRAATEKEVFFPTEFMHGLYDGGAGAGLDDFWSTMIQNPHAAGGFIWAFLDEAVVRTDKGGAYDADGNHAPDGIVGPHREKEASFYTIREIWSPIYIDHQPLTADFNGDLPIENRFSFTDLRQCSFTWRLVDFPSAENKGIAPITMASGLGSPLRLAPGEKGVLRLRLPSGWSEKNALYLSAYGPDHHEIFTWTWALKVPKVPTALSPSSPAAQGKGNLSAEDKGDTLLIRCDRNQYFFDKLKGTIQKVVNPRSTLSLSDGPILAGVSTTLKQFSHRLADGKAVVNADYEGEGSLHVTWTFSPGQLVKLEYTYTQKDSADFNGITFRYPEEKISGMKWLGRGPYRVWKNRLKGQQFGIWQKAANNAVTGETWQYPEFKGYHAEVCWAVIENKESPFTVYIDSPGRYLQMLRPQREKAALPNDRVTPAFPEGNIGFLSGISAIGTKFQEAKVMGPQSQKNAPPGQPVSGTLRFDFH